MIFDIRDGACEAERTTERPILMIMLVRERAARMTEKVTWALPDGYWYAKSSDDPWL